MTKKDYILIAEVLKENKDNLYKIDHDILCNIFVKVLQKDNTRFDASRFLIACGIQK